MRCVGLAKLFDEEKKKKENVPFNYANFWVSISAGSQLAVGRIIQ